MNDPRHRYFIINKPYKMVSQFTSPHKVGLLGHLNFNFPEGIHAVGRLDNLSEGLLVLTTNKKVTRLLFQSETPHKRVYLVQVNNVLSLENLERLRLGVMIRVKDNKNYATMPCQVNIIDKPRLLYKHVNMQKDYGLSTWLLITLTEGKFHQVRKMIKAVNHRCKRLIRVSIEDLVLGDLEPGAVKEIEENDFFKKLKISSPIEKKSVH